MAENLSFSERQFPSQFFKNSSIDQKTGGVFPTLYFHYVNSDSKHPLFFQIR